MRKAALAVALVGLAAVPSAAAAPAWLAPVDLSAPLRDAIDPVVAMDEAGRTVAIWEREGKTPFERAVQASTRELGAAFPAPVDLSVPAQDPKLAMTPGGEAVAAWWHSQGGKYVLQFSRRPPQGAFAGSVVVTELDQEGSPPEIRLAVNPSGKAAVAWVQRNEAEHSAVMVSTVPAGGPPSAPWPVSEPAHDAAGPQVSVDDGGEVAVVWNGYSGLEERSGVIQYSSGSGSSFSASQDVSEADVAASPRLALDPAGEPTVVWLGYQEKPEEEWADPEIPEFFPPAVEAGTSAGGSFGAPVELSSAPEMKPTFSPQLAIGAGGTAVAAWVLEAGAGDQIVQAAARAPGGEFSAPQDVSGEVGQARHPDVAVNPLGVATLAWEGGGTSVIEASIRPPGGPFGAPLPLSAPGSDALFPKVAMSHDGDAVAVWQRWNGANQIVQAAGYDANSPQLHNLSVPVTGTVGVPVPLSVEPFDVWPLAGTSFDFGDGASAPGSSASHAYAAPGTYHVSATATDQAGSSAAAGAEITIFASNEFRLGKLKRDRRRGRATLTVHVPGPGRLILFGRGVRKVRRAARAAGPVRLPIRPNRRALRRLRRGKNVRARITVVFRPTGGNPARLHRKLVLVLKPGSRRHHRRSRR